MELNDKIVLVTGGAVRMGAAICRAFADRGARVLIHYRQSAREASDLCRELSERGGQAWALRADLNTQAACETLIETACETAGGLDVLVNNAAVFRKERLGAVSEESLLDQWRPNLMAPLFLMQSFAQRRPAGRIVNLLDRRIAEHDASCVAYHLSKTALAELTKMAALEWAPRFTVNAVAPGAVLPPPGRGETYMRENAGPIPLDARPTPEEVGEAVVFAATQDSMTGQILFVDGGQHLIGVSRGEKD